MLLDLPPEDERLLPGGLVCLQDGHLNVVPFDDLRDPRTGRTRVRVVDRDSEHYKVARDYMIRLERRDLEEPEMLAKLAEAAAMTPQEFTKLYSSAAGIATA